MNSNEISKGDRMSTFFLSQAGRALRHRNFRLYVYGQGISLIGNWMTRLATSWLVYRLTESALMLGYVSFAGQIVTFLCGPFAGVVVERFNRRNLLICTQVAAAVQSLALAGLTLSGHITIWEIFTLALMQGVINAFDMPGRQSFLVQMVENKNDLLNAIAINSSMVNAARLVGPAIGGVLIGLFGEGICFLMDGVSYFAVIVSLLMMRIVENGPKRKVGRMIEEIREGWSFISSSAAICPILLLIALVSLMGYPYMVLLPVFAAEVLHGGPNTLAMLTAGTGVGALLSALSLLLRRSMDGLSRMLLISVIMLGCAMVLFGLSTWMVPSMVLMVFAGFGIVQIMAVSNTIIQTIVPEDKRARVMSYYTMSFFGMTPFGSLLAGFLAHRIGAPYTLVLTGSACLLGSIWFARSLPRIDAQIRPMYQKMGLTKEKM